QHRRELQRDPEARHRRRVPLRQPQAPASLHLRNRVSLERARRPRAGPPRAYRAFVFLRPASLRYTGGMKPVLRTDLLAHAMNPGKERAVRALLRAWRRGAVMVGREQWRLFYDGTGFNKQCRSPHEDDLAAVIGAANRLQNGALPGGRHPDLVPLESPERLLPHRRVLLAPQGDEAPATLREPVESVVRPRTPCHEGRERDTD